MEKVKIIFTGLILVAMITACDSFNAMEDFEGKKDELRVQTFELSGIEVHYRVAYAAPPDTFEIDTIEVAYNVDLELPKDKPDSLRFYGLPGAKKAYSAHGVNGNYRRCKTPSRIYCDIYARLFEDNTFEMNLGSPSGIFNATGYFADGNLELEGNFYYRGTSIDYFLAGQKVNR